MNLAYVDTFYEIINGRAYLMSPTNVRHSEITGNIYLLFKNYLKGKTCKVFQDVWVHLGKDILAPDISVVCSKNLIRNDTIYGAPDLVAEVMSPSSHEKDRAYKKQIYEQYGVKEYWIVSDGSIEVFILHNGAYAGSNTYHYDIVEFEMLDYLPSEKQAEIIGKSKFVTSIFDLTVNLADIFDDR